MKKPCPSSERLMVTPCPIVGQKRRTFRDDCDCPALLCSGNQMRSYVSHFYSYWGIQIANKNWQYHTQYESGSLSSRASSTLLPIGCPATKKVDIQLILDSSGSIQKTPWTALIEFLKNDFIDAIFVNPDSRLAITKYGTRSEVLQWV